MRFVTSLPPWTGTLISQPGAERRAANLAKAVRDSEFSTVAHQPASSSACAVGIHRPLLHLILSPPKVTLRISSSKYSQPWSRCAIICSRDNVLLRRHRPSRLANSLPFEMLMSARRIPPRRLYVCFKNSRYHAGSLCCWFVCNGAASRR